MNDEKTKSEDLPKSKSQKKREMIALQELGERLTNLRLEQLEQLHLPPTLFQAVIEAKKINSHGAKRRQFQYIGKLMRLLEDPSSLQEYFEQLDRKSQRAIAFDHVVESWREQLINESGQIVTDFINTFPNANRQHLRQLIQNAKNERLTGKPSGAARALFRYIKELQIEKQDINTHT